MVLPQVLDRAIKGSTRKSAALLKAAFEFSIVQGADKHREEGLTGNPVLFGQYWAVGVTDARLHFMVITPLGGVSP